MNCEIVLRFFFTLDDDIFSIADTSYVLGFWVCSKISLIYSISPFLRRFVSQKLFGNVHFVLKKKKRDSRTPAIYYIVLYDWTFIVRRVHNKNSFDARKT